jgi:proline dehydrogenase
MNPMRSLLLAGSRNAWLQRQATHRRFVKLAVRRFMPGESLDEALVAAGEQNRLGLAVTLTHLGENLRDKAEADGVLAHYVGVIDRIRAGNLNAEVSIKPTQLGLDIDASLCTAHARTLA